MLGYLLHRDVWLGKSIGPWKPITFPLVRVIENVLPVAVQALIIANNMLKVFPLPYF
jgi:hypothetical protein